MGLCEFGIVLGGSGNGEAIAANKVKGIRCALCWSEDTARLAKEHNNANIILNWAKADYRRSSYQHCNDLVKCRISRWKTPYTNTEIRLIF